MTEKILNISTGDELTRLVFSLKGRFDRLKVLNLSELDDNSYALNIGEYKDSILLFSDMAQNKAAGKMLLYFVFELLKADDLSLPICQISPSKLLERVSLSVVLSPNEKLLSGDEYDTYLKELANEWHCKRIYLFKSCKTPSRLSYPKTIYSQTHLALMARMLHESCHYPVEAATDGALVDLSTSLADKSTPIFSLDTCFSTNDALPNEIEDAYQKLREFFMLTLML